MAMVASLPAVTARREARRLKQGASEMQPSNTRRSTAK
jgi:hypothetical protein